MNGYQLLSDRRHTYYRQIQPTAGSLIEALQLLPEGTAIETMAGHDGVETPSAVWYDPLTRTAGIG